MTRGRKERADHQKGFREQGDGRSWGITKGLIYINIYKYICTRGERGMEAAGGLQRGKSSLYMYKGGGL